MFTRATRFWHTAISLKTQIHFECQRKSEKQPWQFRRDPCIAWISRQRWGNFRWGRGIGSCRGFWLIWLHWFHMSSLHWLLVSKISWVSIPTFRSFRKAMTRWWMAHLIPFDPIWSHLIPFVDALPIKIVIFIDFPQQTVKLPGRSGMTLASGPRWWCFGGRGRGQRLLGWTRWIR